MWFFFHIRFSQNCLMIIKTKIHVIQGSLKLCSMWQVCLARAMSAFWVYKSHSVITLNWLSPLGRVALLITMQGPPIHCSNHSRLPLYLRSSCHLLCSPHHACMAQHTESCEAGGICLYCPVHIYILFNFPKSQLVFCLYCMLADRGSGGDKE